MDNRRLRNFTRCSIIPSVLGKFLSLARLAHTAHASAGDMGDAAGVRKSYQVFHSLERADSDIFRSSSKRKRNANLR